MLKWLVMVLLAANVVFFAWTQGWLDTVVGVRAIGDRDPGRLAQQVRPESVVILTAKAAAEAASSGSAAASAASSAVTASTSSSCLEAGPFTSPELTAAETALTKLMPANAWTRVAVDVPGIWVVYMGPYRSADIRNKKEAEVKRRGLKFEAFKVPSELSAEQRKAVSAQLIPGFSLGRYASLNSADAALADFAVSGIQSARVVEVLKPYSAQSLKVTNADSALVTRLTGLTGNASVGKPFVTCPASR